MNEKVGISILTNGARLPWLKKCISSFLENCHYRPLVIAIHDNGSTDDTSEWLKTLPETYGVEWRTFLVEEDDGCAVGTNRSLLPLNDCDLILHIESDFELLSPEESGEDKMWLHRAVELLNSGDCDYLYLRRMRDEHEATMHWWSQWMNQTTEERDSFLRCPGFWWSNNPTLFRHSALMIANVLPLDAALDGQKGTTGWSQPELQAPRPPNAWIHQWGVFVHERQPDEDFTSPGCGLFGPFGKSGCKYGYWKDGKDAFCQGCDKTRDFSDMKDTEFRTHNHMQVSDAGCVVAFHSNQLVYGGVDMSIFNYARYNESVLGNRSIVLTRRDANGLECGNTLLDMFEERFPTFLYDEWEEADEWLKEQGAKTLFMRKFGHDDGLVSKHCRTVVCCAHRVREEHGDVYCYISEWLANDMSNGELPWLPHAIEPTKVQPDMRDELGIPRNATVFGWIGRDGSFNLPAGFDAIKALAGDDSVWFLFMGLSPFIDAPNVKFLEPSWSPERKSSFIYTCDAMLQSRWEGDSFGLAVAEFSAAGRPVVTYNGGVAQAHIHMLGEKAILYDGSHDLIPILRDWPHRVGPEWDVFTERFSPVNVMRRFKELTGI